MRKGIQKLLDNHFWCRYRKTSLCLAVSLLSLLFAMIFKMLIQLFPSDSLAITLIDSINEEWYMNTFFSDKNVSGEKASDSSGIVIIDIKDSYSSRKDIADVIQSVSKVGPSVICVDFIFPDNDSYDKQMNDSLMSTLSEVKKNSKLVMASYKGNSAVISHSYFMDSLKLDYGLSDFMGFGNYLPYVEDTLSRIATKVVELSTGEVMKDLPKMIVNYSNKEFPKRTIKENSDIDYSIRNNLKNKIVLIGQCNTSDDIHDTPFLINGQRKIPGIEVIAHELSSLIAYRDNDRNNSSYPYTYLPTWANMLICVVFSFIYVFFLCETVCSKMNRVLVLILKPVYLFCAEYVLIKMCFDVITGYFLKIPNIVLFAASIVFVDFLLEFALYITQKKECYEK